MEIIELFRISAYSVMAVAALILSGYFFREFYSKKLKASLAWGIGFLLTSIASINLAFIATVELTTALVIFGFFLTSLQMSLLYYGTSMLFFSEKSFFREKFTVIYFLVTVLMGTLVVLRFGPQSSLTLMYLSIYIVIAILFFQVSRRIPKDDPRRRTLTLVSAGWWCVAFSVGYLSIWGVFGNPTVEAAALIFGTIGYILLLYGMTTGKTARK